MTDIVVSLLLAILMAACIAEVVVNKLNPTPKMNDRGEEKIFSRTICKTREMYSVIKR